MPIGPEELRRVEVNYVGSTGRRTAATWSCPGPSRRRHRDFEQLHRLGYPIAKMRTVDGYPGADDELSMEDNNTSAFNCRPLPGPTDRLCTPTAGP